MGRLDEGDHIETGKKIGILGTAAITGLLLTTQVNGNGLGKDDTILGECDGINRQGVIIKKNIDGIINGFPEKACVLKNRKEIIEKEKKINIILATLAPEEYIKSLNRKIEYIEKELKAEKDDKRIQKLNRELEKLKNELEDKKNKLKSGITFA